MATEITKLQNVAQYSDLSAIVTDLVTFIKGQDTNVTNAYKALIGELGKTTGENPVDHTVVSYIAAKIAEVNGAADALAGRVKDAEDAIDLLNDASTVEGSVDYKINQAFNDFATKVSDDKVVNTFKEMIDYVAAHQTEYATLGALVGSLPEDAGVTTVVAYAEKLAGAANDAVDAEETRAKGAESDLQDAIDAEKTRAEGVEGEIIAAINDFSYMSAEQLAAIKALIA